MPNQKQSVPVFKVKKKHAWKGQFIRLVEICLILVVIIGTVVWLLISNHFSWQKTIFRLGQAVAPEASVESKPKSQTESEALQQAIQQNHFLEVTSITKTMQGDFQVSTKTGIIIIFSAEKNIEEQVSTLQTLLAKAKIDNKALKKVDFRFSKIVVEY